MSLTLLGDDIKLSLLNVSATIFLRPLTYLIMGPNSSIRRRHHMTCSVLKKMYIKYHIPPKYELARHREEWYDTLSALQTKLLQGYLTMDHPNLSTSFLRVQNF